MIQGLGVNQCVNVTISTNESDGNKYELIATSLSPVFTVTVYYIIICIITSTAFVVFLWINISKSSSCASASVDTLIYPIIEINKEEELIVATSENVSRQGLKCIYSLF